MRLETAIERMGIPLNYPQAEHMGWLRVMGVGSAPVALGTAAIVAPRAATFAIGITTGLLLMVGAAIHLVRGTSWREPGGTIIRIGRPAVYGSAGALLLAFPHQGALTLTFLLAALFIIVGTLGMASALATRPLAGWTRLLAGGAVLASLGIFIWTELPAASAWTLGLLAGIELLLTGRVMILWALALRAERPAPALEQEWSL